MVVPFGHTTEMSDKAHNKNAFMMGGITAIGMSIVLFFLGAREIYIYNYYYHFFSYDVVNWT